MRKIMIAGILSLSLVAGGASAAELALDGTSRTTMQESAREMLMSLSGEERVEFIRSMSVLVAYSAYQVLREEQGDAEEVDIAKLTSDTRNKVADATLATLDGKTAEQVIAEAEKPKYRDTVKTLKEHAL